METFERLSGDNGVSSLLDGDAVVLPDFLVDAVVGAGACFLGKGWLESVSLSAESSVGGFTTKLSLSAS